MYRFVAVLFLVCGYTIAERILAVFPHTGKSHFSFFEPLILELARRGHDVHVLSFFPQKQKIGNYTDYSLVGTYPIMTGGLSIDNLKEWNGFKDFHFIADLGLATCEPVLSSKTVTDLIKSDKEFDLLIYEIFTTECFFGFSHRFKAPFIGMSSTGIMSFHNWRFGNPHNPANVPHLEFPFSDKMNFIERIVNTISVVYFYLAKRYYYDPRGQKIARKYFGEDMPDIDDIINNVTIFFTNNHYSLNRPQPLVPAIIQVGGLHVKSPKPLTQDLERYINDSAHGVILFSMGSVLQAKTFDLLKMKAFMEAFSELPQRVIMKWDGEELPNQPSNVKTLTWLPQRDILAHPNVVAFIAHGGLLGLSEAVYSGVPVVGIPIFGDQPNNVATMVSIGSGVKLDYSTITKDSVLKALKVVLYDQRIKETATKLAAVYKDRPASALDTAVYWTEFVLRHKGAPFLQSAAVHQPWYQTLLLDVVAALLISLATVLTVVFLIARKITVMLSKILYSKDKVKIN